MFISVPALILSEEEDEENLGGDDCCLSVSSWSTSSSSQCTSDRWMSDSVREGPIPSVAAVAAPKRPQRLRSDLSGDDTSDDTIDDEKAAGAAVKEAENSSRYPHQDASPRLDCANIACNTVTVNEKENNTLVGWCLTTKMDLMKSAPKEVRDSLSCLRPKG